MTDIIAHRGASASAPENTLAAFKLADEQDADGIEFDVSTLGDSTPAILHDATTERCSDTNTPIDQLRKEDLKKIDAGSWFNKKYSGERIPLFHEVLNWLNTNNLIANIEIKRHPHQSNIDEFIQPILQELIEYQSLCNRIILSSFDLESLQHCREASSDLNLGILYEKPPQDWLYELKKLNAKHLHIHYPHLTKDILAVAQKNKIEVRCYTPKEPSFYQQWAPLGLNAVIVDDPDFFRQSIS